MDFNEKAQPNNKKKITYSFSSYLFYFIIINL